LIHIGTWCLEFYLNCPDTNYVLPQQPESSNPKNNIDEEEEVDIDLNDPDVAIAALKIQAGFKGFKARKQLQEKQVWEHSLIIVVC